MNKLFRDTRANAKGAALVGRHPICDPRQRTFAYELLFRATMDENVAQITDQEEATARVVVNSVLEIGLDEVIGPHQAFINVTRSFIVSGYCRFLPKDRFIFEILEDIRPDPVLFKALDELRRAGYRFALDDYAFEPAREPLIPYCSYLKVDLRQVKREVLQAQMGNLKQLGISLLAEKVETLTEFDFCKSLGFEYFQGYHFCNPRILGAAKAPLNRLTLCQLVAKLHSPDVSAQEIETLVAQDLALSYRLLRYINSACFALTRKIESIRHAVRLVGTEYIRLLASLIMLTSMADKPQELLSTSLTRAKMCELAAQRLGDKKTDAYFTVGLFSTLDAFLDCSMEDALNQLPLSDAIQDALLRYRGPLGEVLRAVLLRTQGDEGETPTPSPQASAVEETFVDAIKWGQDFTRRFGAFGGSAPLAA